MVYSVRCTVSIAMYNVQCAVYIVSCTMYIVGTYSPSMANDLRVSIATSLHQSFFWNHPFWGMVQCTMYVQCTMGVLILIELGCRGECEGHNVQHPRTTNEPAYISSKWHLEAACSWGHTFSAFWLWSSVVSVLISVTTDMPPTGGLLVTFIFDWGGVHLSLLSVPRVLHWHGT